MTVPRRIARTPTHGRASTRRGAMAVFTKSWRREEPSKPTMEGLLVAIWFRRCESPGLFPRAGSREPHWRLGQQEEEYPRAAACCGKSGHMRQRLLKAQ